MPLLGGRRGGAAAAFRLSSYSLGGGAVKLLSSGWNSVPSGSSSHVRFGWSENVSPNSSHASRSFHSAAGKIRVSVGAAWSFGIQVRSAMRPGCS